MGCKAVFINYRLAPKYPHPTPAEDCYAGLRFAFDKYGANKFNNCFKVFCLVKVTCDEVVYKLLEVAVFNNSIKNESKNIIKN